MNAQARQIVMWGLLCVVGIAMIAGIVAMIAPSRSLPDEVLITALVVGVHAAAGLLLVPIGRRYRILLIISLSSLLVGMSLSVAFIWLERSLNYRAERTLVQFLSFFEILAGVLAHWMLVRPMRLGHLAIGNTLRWITLLSGIVTGILLMMGLCFDLFRHTDIIDRAFGVALIICVGGTMACGAIQLFTRREDDEDPGLLSGSFDVQVVCPRCEHTILARSNRESRCEHCRLKLRVEVEEPRCSCGYLLYQLESDTCPECGKPVEQRERWGTPEQA